MILTCAGIRLLTSPIRAESCPPNQNNIKIMKKYIYLPCFNTMGFIHNQRNKSLYKPEIKAYFYTMRLSGLIYTNSISPRSTISIVLKSN